MVRKLKSRSGLSLAEMLVAVLILLLVSAIVAEGVPVAKNAYEKVVVAANAKVMLTNAVAALRNELALAQRITVDPTTNSITYYSADRGAMSKIYLSGGTGADADYPVGTIMLQEYQEYGDTKAIDNTFIEILGSGWTPTEGVSAKARALITSLEAQRGRDDKLFVCCQPESGATPFAFTNRQITIKGLQVCRDSDKRVLAKYGEGSSNIDLIIRVIPNDAKFAPAAAAPTTAPGDKP